MRASEAQGDAAGAAIRREQMTKIVARGPLASKLIPLGDENNAEEEAALLALCREGRGLDLDVHCRGIVHIGEWLVTLALLRPRPPAALQSPGAVAVAVATWRPSLPARLLLPRQRGAPQRRGRHCGLRRRARLARRLLPPHPARAGGGGRRAAPGLLPGLPPVGAPGLPRRCLRELFLPLHIMDEVTELKVTTAAVFGRAFLEFLPPVTTLHLLGMWRNVKDIPACVMPSVRVLTLVAFKHKKVESAEIVPITYEEPVHFLTCFPNLKRLSLRFSCFERPLH